MGKRGPKPGTRVTSPERHKSGFPPAKLAPVPELSIVPGPGGDPDARELEDESLKGKIFAMKMLEKQTLRSIARTLGIGTPRCNRLWDEMQEQMVNDYTCNNLKIAAREKQFQLHRYDTIEMKLLAVLNEEPGFEIHQTDGGKAVAVHQDNRIGAALALMKLYDRRAMLVGAYAPKVTILDHTGGEKKGPATPDEQQAKMKAVLERREKAAVAHVVEKAEIDPEVLDS